MIYRNLLILVFYLLLIICCNNGQTLKKKEYVDVRNYGVVGDGETDNTQAFQKAADSKKPPLIKNTGKEFIILGRIWVYNSIRGKY